MRIINTQAVRTTQFLHKSLINAPLKFEIVKVTSEKLWSHRDATENTK